jgi:hypothetical protein
MALTQETIKSVPPGDGSVIAVNYEALSEADTAPPAFEYPAWNDQSVQVVGAFGGGNVSVEGSNDGTNWVILKDPAGSAITFTADGLAEIGTPARFIRPKQPTGTSVDVDVFFILRRKIK